ncbi:MAG: arsenate reductase [Marinosulfonomonas sp.]|nr:arsenate reductase [Marinosulfonomonas sp.]PHQ99644.1 MAG: arsenate reductase [Marinosulfonomonas sp.]
MKIYGLKNCDTCRRALRALKAAGHDARLVDVRKDGLKGEELERFFIVFGQDLLNRRSTTWRKLSEDERKGNPVALMLAHPALMKRPLILEEGGLLTLGWGKDEQKHWGINDA